jgi:DtxR family transcriptional regulator, Mn-dependent transcriptional regulator
MTPAINLTVAAAIGLILVVLLRPHGGLLWHWARGRRATERVRIEDALKHLYDCEYARESATLDSLAGALEIGRNEAARLTARLEALGLLASEHRRLTLTPEGCSYALRVIRIHRLLESYLAERTGVDESEWHRRADQLEHRVTAAEAEALSAQLGNPSYDPHGDPIPTPDGVMPSRRGLPLSALKTGAVARIVHVEDEPDEVYAQLVAARLSPGVTLRVLDSKPDRMRIEAEWQEHVLAPVVAANLTVEPLSDVAERILPDSRLSSLAIGQQATVVDLSSTCRGPERRRLLDLGLVPGTVVRAELASTGGDPIAYRIRGAMIALRNAQANLIHVKMQADAPARETKG